MPKIINTEKAEPLIPGVYPYISAVHTIEMDDGGLVQVATWTRLNGSTYPGTPLVEKESPDALLVKRGVKLLNLDQVESGDQG